MLKITDCRSRATADRPHLDLTLAWQPSRPCPPPATVEVRGRNLKTLVFSHWREMTCSEPGAELLWRTPEEPVFNDVSAHNPTFTVGRWQFPGAIRAEEPITFHIVLEPQPVSGGEIPLHVVAMQHDKVLLTEEPVIQRVPAGPAEGFDLFARPAPETDGSVRLSLLPVDANRYPATLSRPAPARITCKGCEVWHGELHGPRIVTVTPSGKGFARFQLHVEAAAVAANLSTVTSNPVRLDRHCDRLPVFGEIHWHTSHSGDGMRPVREALRAGRDDLNLDFAAPGDHTPVDEKWQDTVAALNAFNDSGRFATFFGWEQSSNHGHENFYFTNPDHPLAPGGKAGLRGGNPEENTSLLDRQTEPFVAIPHHTNAVSKAIKDDGTHYWYAYPWKEPRNGYRRIVELMQSRGNFEQEYPPDGWRHEHRGNGGSAQTALDAGHRFGFIAGTDNHSGWPTLNTHERGSRLYAGVWTTARERQAIFDGLFQRHTWACWDTRAIVCFSVNGALQGGELTVAPEETMRARIQLALEAPLDTLELVTNGGETIAVPYDDQTLDLDVTVELDVPGSTAYYYLRARQKNGALIYASPVFVEMRGA